MEKVTKERWNLAIDAENDGWSFNDRSIYMMHERGNLNGQISYAKKMKLFEDYFIPGMENKIHQYDEKIFDMQGKTIVDLCCGPTSIMLRMCNFKKAYGIDPGNFPDYILNRYKENNIEWVKLPAEDFVYPEMIDETILYNALAHVQDPFKILLEAKNNSKCLRICECLYAGSNVNHPQDLTQEGFENTLGIKGEISQINDPPPSPQGLHFSGKFYFNQ